LLALALVLAAGLHFLQRRKPSVSAAPPAKPAIAAASPTTAAPPSPQGQGKIEGEVLLNGTPPPMLPLKVGADPICARAHPVDEQVLVRDGRIRNVVVRLANGSPASAPFRPIEISQEGCIYRPRIQAAVTGQTVLVRTSDPILHNVHAYFGSSTVFNQAQPPGSRAVELTVGDRIGILKIKCDVHPWMLAHVVVTNNPYFGITGDDGRFQIEGIPAGEYVLEAWHERFGKKTSQVRVSPSQTLKVSVTYSPEDRNH
jgi:plastocyanin